MNPVASGRLFTRALGRDLVLTRTFRAPIDDVWASITEPERTARFDNYFPAMHGVRRACR